MRYVRTRGSMRLRRAVKLPTFALSLAARTRHAWLARLTRARGKRYIREGNALLYDFWYFWSYKSTIKEKFLHVSSRVVEGADPVSATPTHMLRICVNPLEPASL